MEFPDKAMFKDLKEVLVHKVHKVALLSRVLVELEDHLEVE